MSLISTGLGAIDIGTELARIAELERSLVFDSTVRVAFTRVRASFARFARNPQGAITANRSARDAIRLVGQPIELSARRNWAEAAIAVAVIDAELEQPWSIATRTAVLNGI